MLTDEGVLDDIQAHFGDRKGYFQQDGAPAHRAKATINMIESHIGLIRDWPANSPDLSVIENVWGILKHRVAERAPKTMDELKQAVFDEWENLDRGTIDRLVQTMTARFRMCMEAEGKSINHLVRKLHPPSKPGDGIPRLIGAGKGIWELTTKNIGEEIMVAAIGNSLRNDIRDLNRSWIELRDHEGFNPPPKRTKSIEFMIPQE
jgi:hypothetical protein